MRLRFVPVLLLLVVSGCGGGGKSGAKPTVFGNGTQQVWLYRPDGKPHAAVVFLHGFGSKREQTPVNHVPWIEHLVKRGDAVIYPRYETTPNPAPGRTLVGVVDGAMNRLGSRPPLVVIGYSRGGRIAPDYAALADASLHSAHPAALVVVDPGWVAELEQPVDLSTLARTTRVLIVVGDRDREVGGEGTRQTLARLEAARFPAKQIDLRIVRSKKHFSANHLAPLGTSPAAQRAYWTPADKLIDAVSR